MLTEDGDTGASPKSRSNQAAAAICVAFAAAGTYVDSVAAPLSTSDVRQHTCNFAGIDPVAAALDLVELVRQNTWQSSSSSPAVVRARWRSMGGGAGESGDLGRVGSTAVAHPLLWC
jgi:hypothetical protein